MKFIEARDLIQGVLISTRSKERKQFIIKQIVWRVFKSEGPLKANGLIRMFDLEMVSEGGMTWFEGEGAKAHRPVVAQCDVVSLGDKQGDYKFKKEMTI